MPNVCCELYNLHSRYSNNGKRSRGFFNFKCMQWQDNSVSNFLNIAKNEIIRWNKNQYFFKSSDNQNIFHNKYCIKLNWSLFYLKGYKEITKFFGFLKPN